MSEEDVELQIKKKKLLPPTTNNLSHRITEQSEAKSAALYQFLGYSYLECCCSLSAL